MKDRIAYLSKLRNKVLNPLWNQTTLKEIEFFDFKKFNLSSYKIIFLNDIYITEKNILNLLSTNDGDFDQACAIDFGDEGFYDSFVARDVNGGMFTKWFPFLND
jgi:alpha-1,3-mannosyltransferase